MLKESKYSGGLERQIERVMKPRSSMCTPCSGEGRGALRVAEDAEAVSQPCRASHLRVWGFFFWIPSRVTPVPLR